MRVGPKNSTLYHIRAHILVMRGAEKGWAEPSKMESAAQYNMHAACCAYITLENNVIITNAAALCWCVCIYVMAVLGLTS